jgi:signal peptidase II
MRARQDRVSQDEEILRFLLRVLWLTFVVVLVDQASKLWVKGISIPALNVNIPGMRYGLSTPVIGDFFRLTYIENPGMAFGIDLGAKLYLSLFSIILTLGIILYLYRTRKESFVFRMSLALILGGAIGNLIDRTFYGVLFNEAPLFHGKVVDFFDVDFFDVNVLGYSLSRWPVFNVADASVTIGIVILLFVHHRVQENRNALQESVPRSEQDQTSLPESPAP